MIRPDELGSGRSAFCFSRSPLSFGHNRPASLGETDLRCKSTARGRKPMKISDRRAIGRAAIVGIVVVVLVIAAGGYYYVSLTPSTSTPPTTTSGPVTPLKIAIVASGPSTAYFAEFFATGVTQAAAKLNSTERPTHVTQAYNVAEANAISVCQN